MMESMATSEGPRLVLRLVQAEDAEYLHGLRTDPAYNTHLSKVQGTAEDQRRWIEDYKHREAAGQEYYYIIERRDNGTRCGAVRLYGIEENRFTWGSWILDANKPSKAALESAVLIYDLGFHVLGLSCALLDVRRENNRTLDFHRRFGAQEIRSDDQDVFFTYSRELFLRDRAKHFENILGTL